MITPVAGADPERFGASLRAARRPQRRRQAAMCVLARGGIFMARSGQAKKIDSSGSGQAIRSPSVPEDREDRAPRPA
jgi:hypothetical protein